MDKDLIKQVNQKDKRPSISNLVQLKLIDSSHNDPNGFNRFRSDRHQKIASIINTPSTVCQFKKFKSCELNKNNNQHQVIPLQSLQSISKHRRCESATKILTLQEIKKEEQKLKIKRQQSPIISRSSSRKIFVSISKRNGQSKEKKEVDPQMKVDCCYIAEQPERRQKLKLNVYKDMARKGNLQKK